MCFEAASKTDKSLRRSDGLRETLPLPHDLGDSQIVGSATERTRSPNLVRVRGTMNSRLLAGRRHRVLGRFSQNRIIFSAAAPYRH